jgi:hypothetical protein
VEGTGARPRYTRPDGKAVLPEMPWKGLNGPMAMAVDGAGNVYVLDNSGFGQVVKLVLG